jgi:RNA polymerase sigma-70 factor (ECF subfamily)
MVVEFYSASAIMFLVYSRNVSLLMSSRRQMSPHDLARLVDTHGPPLLMYARQWCSAPEDVVQEAFVKLMALRHPPREVVPWLYRVVRNAALDAGKTSRRRQQREQAVARPESWFLESSVDGLDADSAVAALQNLPMDQREVIIARIWGDLSFEEIAQVAGCSASTAFRRFSAGIEALQKELGEPCPNPSPNV